MPALFRGRYSLTVPRERLSFWVTMLLALPAGAAIGYLIHSEIGVSQAALFVVVAMVYVTLARGRLVGSSVRIHDAQYPHVFSIVARCAAGLQLPMPMIFVRDDPLVPVLAIGLGEPYSLVISSQWIEHFRDDELAFMIGRELGHIAAGHTRFTSLLSVNGNENPIVSLIFGAWLRKSELTCDRVGLLCCGSLDAAMRAIVIASFHLFGRKIDHTIFAQQAREIQDDSVLRVGEWIGSMPYATKRMDAMRSFMETETYRIHEREFLRERGVPVRATEQSGTRVAKRDCAGWWRRCSAAVIDFIIVFALVQTIFGASGLVVTSNSHAHETALARALTGSSATPAAVRDSEELLALGPFALHDAGVVWGSGANPMAISWEQFRHSAGSTLLPLWMSLYFGLLVALGGQTVGMMVIGLRVVRQDFSRPGVWQSLWRYFLVGILWWLIAAFSPFSRVYLHDRLSGTRLIKTERALARATA